MYLYASNKKTTILETYLFALILVTQVTRTLLLLSYSSGHLCY